MSRDLLTALWSAQQPPALSPREWEALLGQARASRLLARLALHFEARGWLQAVPQRCQLHLESALRYARALHRGVRHETDLIAAALEGVATPVVLLKGAAYVAAGLPVGGGRLFSDIDILVRRDQLRNVELALFSAGWIPEKLDPYDDRYYRTWMHELPPLQHVQRNTFIDVHHTIAPPTSRFVIDGEVLIAPSLPLPGDPRLRCLQPVDMVLHSAVHLMQEGEFGAGLRDLLDIDDLLRHFGAEPGFRDGLFARADQIGLRRPLDDVLFQIDRLFAGGDSKPAARRTLTVPSRLRNRVVGALLTEALRPQHPSCATAASRLARWLMYARSHWLRMPWYQIVPHLLRKAWVRTVLRASAGRPVSADRA